MKTWNASPIRADLLLRLPRELRDEIYIYALETPSALPLKEAQSLGIPPVFQSDPTLYVEASETLYKLNTFILDLEAAHQRHPAELWEPYPRATPHIRHLIVHCAERYLTIKSGEEYEQKHHSCHDRCRWEQLLKVPHLQDLTINMQKLHHLALFTLDFGPVLYALRAKKPALQITFNISFDALLLGHWSDPWWALFRFDDSPPEPYQKMGYVDVSDLMVPPSEEDMAYVQKHLDKEWRQKWMPQIPSIKDGLLGETPENRRALAKHYTVKEPELLRCFMAEHFRAYQTRQQER